MTSLRGKVAERLARTSRADRTPDLTRVYLLVVTIDGMSGVQRTVLTLASQLAETHHVEIISLYRRRATPHFDVDPRVAVTYLHDQRKNAEPAASPHEAATAARLIQLPSVFDPGADALTAWSDHQLVQLMERLEPGVLISTRPALHAAVAATKPRHLLTIAQDHLSFPVRMQVDRLPALMEAVVHGVDGLVTLTGADADDYAAHFPDATARICSIPNAAPLPRVEQPPPLTSRTVVSVGRLERRKGMHRVIAAFAPLADRFPDWRLDIYGSGEERANLQAQVERVGLTDRITLRGPTDDVAGVLDGASVFAMGSLHEGFPMVLLEAFSRALPVVAYDCPRGPSEIIRDGVNGRLIDDGDRRAFTAALAELMSDADRRQALGAQALADVAAYSPEAIGQRWTDLFAELLERRG